MNRAFRMRILDAACVLAILSAAGPGARAQAPTAAAHIDRWLVLGPFPAPLPAFAAEAGEPYTASKLLSYEETQLAGMLPVEGSICPLLLGEKTVWTGASADTNGVSIAPDRKEPAIAYLAAYVEVSRWTKASVSVRSSAPFRATIDGVEVATCDKEGSCKGAKSGLTEK